MSVNEKVALGRLERFERSGQQVLFIFAAARLAVTVLENGLLRVRYAPQGQFRPRRSWAVARDDQEFAGSDFSIEENSETIKLKTACLEIAVRRGDGGIELRDASGRVMLQDAPEQGPEFAASGRLRSLKVLPTGEYYYGFGERTGLLDKRGYRYTCWNVDPVDNNLDHGPGADNMYQSIPFYMALRPGEGGFGLFLNNTFKSVFDVGNSKIDRLAIEAEGGELDYYLFYGPDPATILSLYTSLTGHTPLPPRWALGYHQSRWSYYPEERVREIARQFRERSIPAEVIHLDIDYMDGYRVFTWDNRRFPDPARFSRDLAEQGFKLVTIIDPGVKYEPGGDFAVFNEGLEKDYFIAGKDGQPFQGYVWPDDSVFPDFARAEVRRWWGDLHKSLLESGVRGIWNDMNEPSISSVPFGQAGPHIEIPGDTLQGNRAEPATHAEIHNIYGWLEDMATYQGLRRLRPNERPFVLTRAGYAGIQRWAAVWTGDNSSVWEHLEMAIAQLANLALSGVSFAGTDIGGFWGSSGPELWARWIQLGAFSPFCRGHAADGTPNKEPWEWGEEVEAIVRKYLELRYRLMPYLYSLFEENSRTGTPVLRPPLFHFWQDTTTLQLGDEVMLGEALLLAPVYRPGLDRRLVYLPQPANWYDFWTGLPVSGPYLVAMAPLDTLPLFVRGGSIVPFGPVMQYSDERPLDQLTLEIYLDQNGQASGQLYEDDGLSFDYEQGQSCRTAYLVNTNSGGQVRISANRTGNFQPPTRPVEIRLHPLTGDIRIARLERDENQWEIEL